MIYSWHIFGIHQYPYCRILSRLWLLAGFVWVLAGWVTYFRYQQYDYYQHHHHIFHEFKDQRLEIKNSYTEKIIPHRQKKTHTFFTISPHTLPPFPHPAVRALILTAESAQSGSHNCFYIAKEVMMRLWMEMVTPFPYRQKLFEQKECIFALFFVILVSQRSCTGLKSKLMLRSENKTSKVCFRIILL